MFDQRERKREKTTYRFRLSGAIRIFRLDQRLKFICNTKIIVDRKALSSSFTVFGESDDFQNGAEFTKNLSARKTISLKFFVKRRVVT